MKFWQGLLFFLFATGWVYGEFDILDSTGLKITGYADQISLGPGDTVRFMVSTSEQEFRADLVRLIHGDTDPRGPGFKEEPIPAEFAGTYPGRRQTWRSGSHIEVPDSRLLDLSEGFTIQAWIFPTLPGRGAQGLVTKWSVTGGGYGLFIDDEGRLSLWLAGPEGKTEQFSSASPLRNPVPFNGGFQVPDSNWYFVAATYDARSGEVFLLQEPLSHWPGESTRSEKRFETPLGRIGSNRRPLLMAAFQDEEGEVRGHYSGKIDRPRIFNRALDREELRALAGQSFPEELEKDRVAFWDFSRDPASDRVSETGPHSLHGRTRNMPQRAMTGANWKGEIYDFKEAPAQYGAIHFHEDDLRDARWEADFEFQVPQTLPSGVYAARVRAADGEDYLPFFVRPSPAGPRKQIAFLMPTFTYLAYANIGNGCSNCRQAGSLGLYHRHSDSTGVAYTSHLRPILDMRPKAVTRWRAGGQTPRHFSGDLYMVDWLEAKGFEYDVITDHDLHREGVELLEPYRVVISGSHPEYVSRQMLDALEAYLNGGGRFMYLGGNGFYWVTSMSPQAPHFLEIRRWGGSQGWEAAPGEYYHSTTGELGGLWRLRGRPPQKLVGVGFAAQGFDRNASYDRRPESFEPRYRFIFEGVGPWDKIGDFPSLGMGRGAVGDEIDRLDPGLGTPLGVPSLAVSEGLSEAYLLVVEDLLQSRPNLEGSVHPDVRADIVYFKYPEEGGVFSVGSISWFECLSANGYDNSVSRITENVLRRFSSAGSLP